MADFLGRESERWSGEDTIGIHAATSELLVWVEDGRRYVRSYHYAPLQSAIGEFQYCLESVGSSLKQLISPMHSDLISHLHLLLKDPEKPNRGPIKKDLQQLVSLLESPESLLACWQDFLRACKRPECCIPKIARLRDEFWDIAVACKHNTREMNSLLKGTLRDDSQAVYQAKVLLGGDTSGFPVGIRERVNKPAGLGFVARETLCAQIVKQNPRVAEHVVWLAYTSAKINTSIVEAGPVRLFDGPSLRSMPPGHVDFPPEFRNSGVDYKRIFPEEEKFVLVRVNLGVRAVSDAVSLARKQAMVVLVAGSQHASGRGGAWKEYGNRIHIMDGRIVSQTFGRSAEVPVTSFRLDPLAHGIDRAARRVASLLPIESQPLGELLNALDLWDKAKGYDPASSVLVHVRLIESIASYAADKDWVDFCNRVFKFHWVWDDLIWKLRNVVHDATYGFSAYVDTKSYDSIERMRKQIFTDVEGRLQSDMEVALSSLPDLSNIYPDRELTGYELRSINRDYSSCDRLNASRKALIARWDRAMARLERVRNSLTHGGPVTDESLKSVSAFSRKLAGGLIGDALNAALDGKQVAEAMEEMAESGQRWESNARASVAPKDFLFG
ncbi:hypothetical protein [Streptomyces sp. NPDC051214]|uniref:hypothetical protein n=1 Tax=Streptomyces sp. NPDC051214 TaxID=3155282 RepID=UPI00341C744B